MFLAVVRDFACFRVFSFFLRIFAEFSRKFALKVHAKPYEVGVRFFFYTIAKVFRRFQVARDSFSLEKPRKLRSRLSKFRIFALIVLLQLEGWNFCRKFLRNWTAIKNSTHHSQIALWVAAKPWKSNQISRFWRQSNLTWRVMGWDFFSGPFADRSSSTCLLTFLCSISFFIL